MRKLSGGGIQTNKLVHPGIRTGSPSKGSSPAAASQLGQSTAFRKEQVETGRGYDGAKLGNEIATNVGKGGAGTGRNIYRCGTQSQHGPVAGKRPEPSRDFLSQFGPERSKG
jgi:hypothetical protein